MVSTTVDGSFMRIGARGSSAVIMDKIPSSRVDLYFFSGQSVRRGLRPIRELGAGFETLVTRPLFTKQRQAPGLKESLHPFDGWLLLTIAVVSVTAASGDSAVTEVLG